MVLAYRRRAVTETAEHGRLGPQPLLWSFDEHVAGGGLSLGMGERALAVSAGSGGLAGRARGEKEVTERCPR